MVEPTREDAAPDAAPAPAGPKGRRARRGRVGAPRRRTPGVSIRETARRIALLGAANLLGALLLPWLAIGDAGLNAFQLGNVRDGLGEMGAGWVALVAWPALAAAALVAVLVLADRARSFGVLPGAAALAAGAAALVVSGWTFASVVVLRQLGEVALGVAGLLLAGGGALMLRARWEPLPAGRESVFARPRELPWATISLVAANVLAYLALAFRDDYHSVYLRELGLIGGSLKVHAFATCMFLHVDWFHLVTNMCVLAGVGVAVERRVGSALFLLVYLAAGLAGSAVDVLVDPRVFMPSVGASGAIAGVMGLLLATAPRARVTLWVHAGVAAGAVRVRAAWLVSAWMALQSVGALYLAIGAGDSTGYWAHLGGVAAGYTGGIALRALGRVRADGGGGEADAPTRASRRESSRAAGYLPHAVAGVAVLVSAAAVALTFTTSTLLGTLGRFQSAWNSGDLERVEALFREESRATLLAGLRRVVSRLDPDAPAGTTDYSIALIGARVQGGECRAVYASAPPGMDPFRDKRAGTLFAVFRRERGGWRLRAASLREIHPSDASRD
ncbi:MAG: rhomboid family intramembrane serine protease [Planctomycetota bacterium]|jgi:membrane associated rhomboid family serine protease